MQKLVQKCFQILQLDSEGKYGKSYANNKKHPMDEDWSSPLSLYPKEKAKQWDMEYNLDVYF